MNKKQQALHVELPVLKNILRTIAALLVLNNKQRSTTRDL